MWAVFTVTDRDFAGRAAGRLAEKKWRPSSPTSSTRPKGKGIVTRGCYDLQGMRADADYMLWWVAPTSDELQEMYVNFRRTKLGYASEPVWSAMALHRPAEFNKGHIPAFLAEEEPKNYVCVYPFVRSYEWYLLDPAERTEDARRARHDGARVPGRAGQHGQQLRAERLRVDARLRGRRAATGSSTSCVTCAARRRGGTPGSRSPSTPAAASPSPTWSPRSPSRRSPGRAGARHQACPVRPAGSPPLPAARRRPAAPHQASPPTTATDRGERRHRAEDRQQPADRQPQRVPPAGQPAARARAAAPPSPGAWRRPSARRG